MSLQLTVHAVLGLFAPNSKPVMTAICAGCWKPKGNFLGFAPKLAEFNTDSLMDV